MSKDDGSAWFNLDRACHEHLAMLDAGKITDQEFDHWFLVVSCVWLYERNGTNGRQ